MPFVKNMQWTLARVDGFPLKNSLSRVISAVEISEFLVQERSRQLVFFSGLIHSCPQTSKRQFKLFWNNEPALKDVHELPGNNWVAVLAAFVHTYQLSTYAFYAGRKLEFCTQAIE